MHLTISTFLGIIACVLLFLAAFGVSSSRVNLGWLGLALWVMAHLVNF